MSEPIVYPLKYPVEIKSAETGEVVEKITELKLRRPKGKQLKVIDTATGEVGKTLALIAACSGQTLKIADELDGEDIVELGVIVEGFFGGRLPTGATFSAT